MKTTHRLGIISFCNQLTEPDAKSVPIACLLVGQDENSQWVAAAVGWTPQATDPISERLLSDVPRLVRSHVENVLSKPNDEWTTESILHSLHDELRNSVHVSWVGPEVQSELEDTSIDIIRLAKAGLAKAMEEMIAELEERHEELSEVLGKISVSPRKPSTLMNAIERSSSVQWFPAVVPTSSPAMHALS